MNLLIFTKELFNGKLDLMCRESLQNARTCNVVLFLVVVRVVRQVANNFTKNWTPSQSSRQTNIYPKSTIEVLEKDQNYVQS